MEEISGSRVREGLKASSSPPSVSAKISSKPSVRGIRPGHWPLLVVSFPLTSLLLFQIVYDNPDVFLRRQTRKVCLKAIATVMRDNWKLFQK